MVKRLHFMLDVGINAQQKNALGSSLGSFGSGCRTLCLYIDENILLTTINSSGKVLALHATRNGFNIDIL